MRVADRELARQLEAAEAGHWGSLLKGLATLNGNPYGAEVKQFGSATALVCPGMPRRSLVNRVLLAERTDELGEAIRYFRGRGLRCRIDVTPFSDKEILLFLERQGFRQRGFQMALYLDQPSGSSPVHNIHRADTPELRKFAADALPVSFGETDGTWIRWLTDSMRATFDRQDWQTYVALVDNEPAGFAQLHIEGAIGCLALAGTLPAFRGRGAQRSLIRRRMADAFAAGCRLVCTQTGSGTISQHNMEREGFRVGYTKAEFYDSLSPLSA